MQLSTALRAYSSKSRRTPFPCCRCCDHSRTRRRHTRPRTTTACHVQGIKQRKLHAGAWCPCACVFGFDQHHVTQLMLWVFPRQQQREAAPAGHSHGSNKACPTARKHNHGSCTTAKCTHCAHLCFVAQQVWNHTQLPVAGDTLVGGQRDWLAARSVTQGGATAFIEAPY